MQLAIGHMPYADWMPSRADYTEAGYKATGVDPEPGGRSSLLFCGTVGLCCWFPGCAQLSLSCQLGLHWAHLWEVGARADSHVEYWRGSDHGKVPPSALDCLVERAA